MSVLIAQLPFGVGMRWKICANLSGVAVLPSTARLPVTNVMIVSMFWPGWLSVVVTECCTVLNCSVCSGGPTRCAQ